MEYEHLEIYNFYEAITAINPRQTNLTEHTVNVYATSTEEDGTTDINVAELLI